MHENKQVEKRTAFRYFRAAHIAALCFGSKYGPDCAEIIQVARPLPHRAPGITPENLSAARLKKEEQNGAKQNSMGYCVVARIPHLGPEVRQRRRADTRHFVAGYGRPAGSPVIWTVQKESCGRRNSLGSL